MENKLDTKLLLIGGGGHCHSVLDSILSGGLFQTIGIVDNRLDSNIERFPIVGKDEDLPRLHDEGWTHAFVAVGSIGDPSIRKNIYQQIKKIGFVVPNIIDPSAVIAKSAVFGEGVFVGKRAVINANTDIGTCAILNTGCIVEHDCKIGAFAHISPGTVLCGNVQVEDNTHIGAGSIVRQQIHIGENVLIGAGSIVLKNILAESVAYGNPCRVVERK